MKKHIFSIILLGVMMFLAYLPSLNGTWALDDVVANKPVGISDIHDLIGFRKVTYVTFLMNQLIAPFSPANFRLFNILIHFLNVILVYVIAYKTILLCPLLVRATTPLNPPLVRGGLKRGENQTFYAAFISAIIFALHPLNINAVAYIVQRMASLATLFVLLALLFYIAATQAHSKVKGLIFYVLSAVCVVAGIFSKENALMAIPLVILYDYAFLSRFKVRALSKRILVIGLAGFICIFFASYLLKLHTAFIDIARLFLNPNQPLTGNGWMATDVYWTPLQHILTEFRIVSRYTLLIFLPLPQFLVFDWWGFPVSAGVVEPVTTLISMIFLASLLIFSVWKFKRFPLLCFGILWYLIAISLESFIALGSDLYFEHRNYLPLSGLAIGIAGQVVMSLKGRTFGKTLLVISVLLCTGLGLLTFSRNHVWRDSVTLWEDTIKKSPSNLRAMIAMGNTYLRLSDAEGAERYYRKAVQIGSRDKRMQFFSDAAYSLGMVYLFKGDLGKAKELIDKLDYFDSYRIVILKAYYKVLNNDINGALKDYRQIVEHTEGLDRVVVVTLMGDAYYRKGLWDDAIEHYEKAIALDPGFTSAYYGIGVAFMGKRDTRHAYEYFKKALDTNPDDALVLSDLADLMLIKNSKRDAFLYAEKAISKSPSFYQPYLTMANVLIVHGEEKEAEKYYRKALRHNMPVHLLPFSKARAYFLKGDMEKMQYYLSEAQKYKDFHDRFKDLDSLN
ncbi:MAG: tetratricopeptide repeat protein [Nitrospirota bacterium]